MAVEEPLYDGENLHVYPRTMFGTAFVYDIETEDDDEVRVLEVGGVFESATYIDHRRFEPTFAYYYAFDHLFEAFPEPDRVLMIGGGGFAYPKHFIASQPYGSMDVVEIDPVITRIARRHFFLDELIEDFDTRTTGRLNIVTADGFAYLKEDGPSYDVIINDSFSGGEATSSLVEPGGLKVVKNRLSDRGVYLINVICDLEVDARPLLQVVENLRGEFANVHVVPCVDDVFGDADNNLVIATDGEYEFTDCLPSAPELGY
ncbi:MAG: fused MFS/spermidine synthase [Eggerthellaceae bacterium]|nr:fused MFS/spermidine synthase [Eggerthellaceae bacterium]